MFGIPFIVNFFACIWYDAGTNQYTLHNDEFSSHMNRISGNSNNHALPFRSEYLQLICHWTFWLPIKCTWYAMNCINTKPSKNNAEHTPNTRYHTASIFSACTPFFALFSQAYLGFFLQRMYHNNWIFIHCVFAPLCLCYYFRFISSQWRLGERKNRRESCFCRLSTLWSSLEWTMSGSTSPDWHSIKKIRTWKSLIREITEKARKFIFGKRRHSQESVTI